MPTKQVPLVLAMSAFLLNLHHCTLMANDFAPIKPEKRFSSFNASFCCVRYRNSLSHATGDVVYVCGVSSGTAARDAVLGSVLTLDLPNGDTGHYQICCGADLRPDDSVLYIVEEKHPAIAWFYDGVGQSLVTLGEISFADPSTTEFIRIYRKDGMKDLAWMTSLKRSLTGLGFPLTASKDDSSPQDVYAWLDEKTRTLFLVSCEQKICVRASLDGHDVEIVNLDEAIRAALQSNSCRSDALGLLTQHPTLVEADAVLAVANDNVINAIQRVRAAYVAARLGNRRSEAILIEFTESADNRVRFWAEHGLSELDSLQKDAK